MGRSAGVELPDLLVLGPGHAQGLDRPCAGVGVCYGGKRFYDQGGLAGKKALVTVTLGGREHMFGEGAIHGPLEDMLRPILRGTLAYVGFEVLPPFVAWHVPYISAEARQDFAAIPAAPGAAADDQPLVFPA